jgi:hypothetical protein
VKEELSTIRMNVEDTITRAIQWGKDGIWFYALAQPIYSKVLGKEFCIHRRKVLLRSPDKNDKIRMLSKIHGEIYMIGEKE